MNIRKLRVCDGFFLLLLISGLISVLLWKFYAGLFFIYSDVFRSGVSSPEVVQALRNCGLKVVIFYWAGIYLLFAFSCYFFIRLGFRLKRMLELKK